MPDIFERLGLRHVINVSGTETSLGGTPVCDEVIAAVTELVPHSVSMAELQSAACQVIARALGSEAGCVTGCTAGSIAISIAATMTGRNLALAEQLPDTSGMKNEVVMQKGHEVTYGQSVSQNIRIAGARVIEIGAATECSAYQLRNAITSQMTAAFYVVSHLTVQNKLIGLETFCDICHQAGVPVIVDAASQPDPRIFISAGADVVLFSTQKAFGSLTGGVIAGRKDLVQACLYQGHGIGRPMKPGKEVVVGAITALERWMKMDRRQQAEELRERMERAVTKLNQIDGITASINKSQIILKVSAQEEGFNAYRLAQELSAQTPSIVVWDHFAADGELRMTFRLITDQASEYVCESIAEAVASTRDSRFDGATPLHPGDRTLAELEQWPLPAVLSW